MEWKCLKARRLANQLLGVNFERCRLRPRLTFGGHESEYGALRGEAGHAGALGAQRRAADKRRQHEELRKDALVALLARALGTGLLRDEDVVQDADSALERRRSFVRKIVCGFAETLPNILLCLHLCLQRLHTLKGRFSL